uniref:Uncharacterized protein n=1 Tax=Brassica oleracea TaxID=3712 RepID=A0A3P6FG18_BRAOL|nr:unnamed protein product [Brassica oleracea]
MRGAHGDDMLFVNEKVPSQLSSNDSVAYNACSPHHNSLNKPVAKILFPEIKTSKLKGAYSLLVKIFARAGDFQNQVQPLEEALNRMSMRVVEYEKYSLQEDTSLVTVIGETFDQLVLNCPENILLLVSNENESWFCGGEAAGSSSTTSKYGGVKELKSVTLQELNSCVLNSTPHVRPLNKVYF